MRLYFMVPTFRRILLVYLSLATMTGVLFLYKANGYPFGQKAYVRNMSNFFTQVKVIEPKSRDGSILFGSKPLVQIFKLLSEKSEYNAFPPFPTKDTNLVSQKISLPILKLPLSMRLCAKKLMLDSSLVYIEQWNGNFGFAQWVRPDAIRITKLSAALDCNLSQSSELILTNSGVLKIRKLFSLDPILGPYRFAKAANDFLIINRIGLLSSFTSTGTENKIGNFLTSLNTQSDSFQHLGVKSVLSLGNDILIVAAVADRACAYITVYKVTRSNPEGAKEIFKSVCIVDLRKIDSNFVTDMNGSGGRIINSPYDPNSVIFSVGQPEIWQGSEPISPNPQLGLLLEMNLKTMEIRVLSKGHRNVQGICYSGNDLLVTEQGPQGGDELNIILQGGDYGWPFVSHGWPYGVLVDYPRERQFGTHNVSGFIPPAFAWVPSIAISALSCPTQIPDNKEYWVFATTLKDLSLHKIFLSNNKIIYDERIYIGERIRDIYYDFKSGNGYLLTDSGNFYNLSYEDFRK